MNERYLVTTKQHFDWLPGGFRAAFYEHSQDKWKTKATTKAYLHSMAIDDIIQKRVCDAANQFKSGENMNGNNYIPPIQKIGFRKDIFVETIYMR